MTLGSVRHEVRIHRAADDVWALAGDPTRLHEWFPGIVDCRVDGTTRVITTATGLPMPEEILVVDPVQRRFQYRITAPIFRHHRGTIDVIDLGDGTCLAVYSTEADPRTSVAQSRLEEDPRLVTFWAGYAFSHDFNEERGHAYMLLDQRLTGRQQVVQQPGACVACAPSIAPW